VLVRTEGEAASDDDVVNKSLGVFNIEQSQWPARSGI
jgi:hypothetical protein